MQANCRYGPGTAYLYSHGLYPGDGVLVEGRSMYGSWYWVQPENLDRHCWAAASVLDYEGSNSHIPVVITRLPQASLYSPPENVRAFRDGDTVTIQWDPVWMTEDDDRGYLIEAYLCQNGGLVWAAVQTYRPSYVFHDEPTCFTSSTGKLYTVEKHGYTDPVPIPWPD